MSFLDLLIIKIFYPSNMNRKRPKLLERMYFCLACMHDFFCWVFSDQRPLLSWFPQLFAPPQTTSICNTVCPGNKINLEYWPKQNVILKMQHIFKMCGGSQNHDYVLHSIPCRTLLPFITAINCTHNYFLLLILHQWISISRKTLAFVSN